MALPKTFTGGGRLFAEDLNDNFQALDTAVATAASDATNASNLAFGTVPVERLPNIPANKVSGDGFPIKIAHGQTPGSNTSSGSTVTFPAGLFSTTPSVATGSGSDAARYATIGGLTSTGFTAYTFQANGAYNAHGVWWIAVGL